MNIWEAFLLAAAFTLVCAGYVGKKVIKIDLSGLLPKNWKRAKRRRLLAERRTPLQGAGLRDDIKKSFENVLLPLGRADEEIFVSEFLYAVSPTGRINFYGTSTYSWNIVDME